jgi:rhodanese-related sulfurtransferase
MNTIRRDARRALAAGGATLAVLAAIVGSPAPSARVASFAAHDVTVVSPVMPINLGALQLAAWIREGARDLRVLDLRGDSAYESQHIPSARPVGLPQLDSLAADVNATLVVYSDDDVRDIQAWASLAARGHRRAYVLSGGMSSWVEEVMEPVLRGDSADYVAALSRYFGGVPRTNGTPERATKPKAIQSEERAPATTDAFGESERRGC